MSGSTLSMYIRISYMYMCIYIHVYTYTCIYIDIHVFSSKSTEAKPPCHIAREVGGWGRVPFSRNLMSPTPCRKWYLTTGRRAHEMVIDPIPQSLPVYVFGSRPQPPTSPSHIAPHKFEIVPLSSLSFIFSLFVSAFLPPTITWRFLNIFQTNE